MPSLVTKQAPDFTAQAVLPDDSFAELTLSSYRGKYVVLFFYPLDFTFVCPSEIIAFDKALPEFERRTSKSSACRSIRTSRIGPGGKRLATGAGSVRSATRWCPI